jgi:hypothetical protein
MRRIKKQLVTSMYKIPVSMTPTELSYIFSTKVKQPQLYATLLDLANRSIIVMHDKHGKITVENGPKIDKNIHIFEKLLLDQFKDKPHPVNVERVISGFTNYELPKGSKITGSRQYVYWWLLRETLRSRGIIQRHLSKRYASMLLLFGVVGSLVISILSIVAFRFIEMIDIGEVDFGRLYESATSGFVLWLMLVIPMLFISYGLLKYRGRMLGRDWIMTKKYRRYLGQMDAFREFVRLTHKDKLRFESKELKKESIALTRPYAIACGYIKK